MSSTCELIVNGQTHTVELVELSLRGARVKTALKHAADVTFGFQGELIAAEVRFIANGEMGLQLRPETKEQRGMLRRVLHERVMREPDGRRAFTRLTTRWKVALVSHNYELAWVTDMALGGIGMQTGTQLQVGDVVRLGFPPIAQDAAFVVTGTVRHVQRVDKTSRRVGIALDASHDSQRYADQLQACWELGDGV